MLSPISLVPSPPPSRLRTSFVHSRESLCCVTTRTAMSVRCLRESKRMGYQQSRTWITPSTSLNPNQSSRQ